VVEALNHCVGCGALDRGEGFVWLDPPASLGEITVLHVREAEDLAGHTERVRAWSVWEVAGEKVA
jgi:hypothetical protein